MPNPDIGFTTIRFEKKDLEDVKKLLADVKNGFPKAFSRALNKSATGTRTDMVNLARREYNYRAAYVRDRTSVNKATYSRLTASVESVGPGVHLTDMLGTRALKKKGVSVNVKKSTGKEVLSHAFIAHGRNSGKEIVFERALENGTPVGRYDIVALYAPHPELVYNSKDNWAELNAGARKRLDVNLDHEVDVILKGIA
jgi:hypothetical protein